MKKENNVPTGCVPHLILPPVIAESSTETAPTGCVPHFQLLSLSEDSVPLLE